MRVKIASLAVLAVVPVVMASSCQTRSAMEQVRNVHMSVREAFRATDEFVAPRLEDAADLCIRRSETAHHADYCMRKWLQLDDALSLVRESMASLEVVYDNIENDRNEDWQYWILQILRHGRSIVNIMVEINIEGADPIIEQIRNTLNGICQVANCEGGT